MSVITETKRGSYQPEMKTTLATARISLFHRLLCVVMMKARLLCYHGKNSKE